MLGVARRLPRDRTGTTHRHSTAYFKGSVFSACGVAGFGARVGRAIALPLDSDLQQYRFPIVGPLLGDSVA